MVNYEQKYNDLVTRLQEASHDPMMEDERFCCVINARFPELVAQRSAEIPYINPDDMVAGLVKRGVSLTSDQAAIYRMGVEDTIKKMQGEQKPAEWDLKQETLLERNLDY